MYTLLDTICVQEWILSPLLADHVFIQIYRHNYRYTGICLRFKKALFIFSLKPWVLWTIHSRISCCGNILFYAKFSLGSCWYHSMPKKILKCSLTKTSRVIKCYVKKKKVSCLKGKYFERTSTWRESLTQVNKRNVNVFSINRSYQKLSLIIFHICLLPFLSIPLPSKCHHKNDIKNILNWSVQPLNSQ